MKNSIHLLFLLAFITIINYFDRSAISYAILPIESELGLNNEQFGLIGGGFGIGYFIMTIFAGFFIDRFGSVAIFGVSALVWSIVTMTMGLASGFWSFMTLRILLGLAEGFNSPAILRTVSDWLDPKWRGRSLSMALLGVPVASLIASPFITFLIEKTGWRMMFVFLGCLGFFWVVLWFLHFRKKKSSSEPYAGIVSLKSLLTSVPYMANCFNFFSFGCTVFFALIWLPGYLEQVHKISIKEAGFLIMAPWIVSALFQISGGWLVDHLWRRTGSVRISRVYPMCFGLFMTGICFLALLFSHTLQSDLILISLGLGFTFLINPSIYSINADLFPKNPATAQSISTCFFALAGIVSPSITGFFSHRTGSFHEAIAFIAILPFLAAISAFIFQRRI